MKSDECLAETSGPRQDGMMSRSMIVALSLALGACGASEPPIHSPSSTTQLFRGGQTEVRLRCGSESLRARLRQGQVAVQLGTGESATLVPVDDPRAKPGQAYGDGRLTLYKVRDADSWRLARSTAPTPGAECQAETRPN